MKKSAKQIGIESAPRISRTKLLNLKQRTTILNGTIVRLGGWDADKLEDRIYNSLIDDGYEPMMFSHAFRILVSKRKGVEA